ncbi:protein EXORDIUM-like 7 [Canna indica]|uniref:Protein EXORDIUM-like 7 n=1 Tax=Canna indica TaxID=4628 RepID=A0AAQ3KFI3_9LILI|nr:protein EXORDIUM-like 7 [Canna indica]
MKTKKSEDPLNSTWCVKTFLESLRDRLLGAIKTLKSWIVNGLLQFAAAELAAHLLPHICILNSEPLLWKTPFKIKKYSISLELLRTNKNNNKSGTSHHWAPHTRIQNLEPKADSKPLKRPETEIKQHTETMTKLCFLCFLFLSSSVMASSSSHLYPFQTDRLAPSSELIDVAYHMGPVFASAANIYIIWYGRWEAATMSIIRDFLLSLSSTSSPSPSVADWWRSVRLYTDQTGSNITGTFVLAGELHNAAYTHGASLSRLAIQSVIRSAVAAARLPLDPHNGLYLVLTSPDVAVEDFCREVCGFHYFTFPAIVGVTVPYAWVGHSGAQCPGMCAYPFALPEYMGRGGNASGVEVLGPPNGDVGADGMVSVIGHELAEMASNPLINAWFAGDDPAAPTEIADLCVGTYGRGSGGGYVGNVFRNSEGVGFNMNGVNGRRFLVQWVWNPVRKGCFGPNAMD